MSIPSDPNGGWGNPGWTQPPTPPADGATGWASPPPGPYGGLPAGYGPPAHPPPGYAAPGYGYGYGGAREHPDGTTILVLGILSLLVCGPLGFVAWVKGNRAIHEIDANPSAYSNRGAVQAGRICGIVAASILIAGLLLVVVAIVIGAIGASTSSN